MVEETEDKKAAKVEHPFETDKTKNPDLKNQGFFLPFQIEIKDS